jgi:hypothetical protein
VVVQIPLAWVRVVVEEAVLVQLAQTLTAHPVTVATVAMELRHQLVAHPLLMLVVVAGELQVPQIPQGQEAQVVVVQGLLGRVQPHLELPTQAVAGVEFGLQTQEQAVQASSSLNTSPNLITKSSNHQAHGLHLVALLRSST